MTAIQAPPAASDDENNQRIEHILVALRRVMRATDQYSRQLVKKTGLTAPQLLLLQVIQKRGETFIGELAAEMSLSHATVTTIVDRLEGRALVERVRCAADRRRVQVILTSSGERILQGAPLLLQDQFVEQFSGLGSAEQEQLISSLQKIAQMMDAEAIDASPVLDVGPLDQVPSLS